MGSDERGRVARGTRRLARDDVLAIEPGPGGVVLRALAGTVLATQSGDPQDHVLEAGASVCLAGRGRIAVWALEPAAVEVRPAEAFPRAA
ncbi:MAG TPA: DUF2917 domain-containing protein [Anaeromyxobacteraceae bacterium]|nr:DUF2917 domain-containing protein [Anaeromyxobacteraceae bacterium]